MTDDELESFRLWGGLLLLAKQHPGGSASWAVNEIERLRTQCGGNCRYWEGRWRDEAKENELLLAVIEKLNTEIERQRTERDVWKIACNAQANEVERLRAERRVISGTNIPDAGTPSY